MNDKLVTVAENCVRLHAACADNHFVTTVYGNGTDKLTVHVPIAPDGFFLFCTDPILRTQDHLVSFFTADLGTLGYICAVSQCSNGGVLFNMAMTNSSVFNRYSRDENGTVTLQNISAKSGYGIFGAGLEYTVVAVKCGNKTDKQRFTELVERLEGSGTIQVWGDKVHAAFTDEQWAALRATKPNWTFEEV